jgi:hypothetical protein
MRGQPQGLGEGFLGLGMAVQLPQHDPEVVPGRGHSGHEAGRLMEVVRGLIQATGSVQEDAQVAVGFGHARMQLQGLPVEALGVRQAPEFLLFDPGQDQAGGIGDHGHPSMGLSYRKPRAPRASASPARPGPFNHAPIRRGL